ncbi:hypothetical protein K503DRAFT_19680 [Rhizopogon vinicolor AM-OR11-026]|uniref:Uncharacterized protein n=1 Tax=Rhizopogon vinicolor AM-OR11-026 TaxID=1314800 RepID=A0A1B7N5Q0_9AGAM|nr:hypothetical protein K503DRAFT_19680 [Rhizopogon vinicolor AM-OR11-026]
MGPKLFLWHTIDEMMNASSCRRVAQNSRCPFCNLKRQAQERLRSRSTIRKRESKEHESGSSSWYPQSSVVQQPTVIATSAATTSGSSQPPQSIAPLTLQPHPAVSTPSTRPANLTTLTNPLPDVTIPQAGCWTRFWLFICCAPAQYTDGQI